MTENRIFTLQCMSYDNLSSVSQNVQVIVRHRICLQTDGHGETSIPPYNFVAGGIIIKRICQEQQGYTGFTMSVRL
jgi:hypothetical protein